MKRLEWAGNGHLTLRSFHTETRAQNVDARISISEARLEMGEQTASSREDFRIVLGKQQKRVVAVLAEAETIDATPIIRDDEDLSCEEYVTLVYELHHVHLPELEAAGIVEFDRREETVRRGAHFNRSQIFK